jgi:hypothetical protein
MNSEVVMGKGKTARLRAALRTKRLRQKMRKAGQMKTRKAGGRMKRAPLRMLR